MFSGGYEDDQDLGSLIIYTRHGGRDPNSGRQVKDQELTLQNLALARNKALGLPVCVIRGGRHRSPFSPESGLCRPSSSLLRVVLIDNLLKCP